MTLHFDFDYTRSMPSPSDEWRVRSGKRRVNKFSPALVFSRLSLVIFLLTLFTIHYSLLTSPAAAAAPRPPNPQPCNNPVVTDNLTDNFATDDDGEGDPPGPVEEGLGANPDANREALKFTVTRSGNQGGLPSPPIIKNMTYRVDFSRLQALFGANNSNYSEGLFQDQKHAQTNLLALGSKVQSYQGIIQKTAPKVMTDALRENYVKYVSEKPEIGESNIKFTDFANSAGSEKTVYNMVNDFGGLPQAPKAGEDKTEWNNTWGKYWEKIPTTYDEFYLGKLEFRAYLGQPTIEKLKGFEVDNDQEESKAACNNFTLLRTVEFPVPRFFRTAQTTGVMNGLMLPKVAQSQENNLIDIRGEAANGAVAGAKNSVTNLVETCFNLATKNPVSKVLKKVMKVSMEKTKSPRYAFVKSFEQNISKPTSNAAKKLAAFAIKNLNPVKDVYAASCSVDSADVFPGDTKTVRHSGFAAGESIRIFGTGKQQELEKTNDSLGGSRNQVVDIPGDTPPGNYHILIVTRFPITTTDCGEFNVVAPPTCTIDKSTAYPGDTIRVSTQNGLGGTIYLFGGFGTLVDTDGSVPINGSANYTLPNPLTDGLYVVRVGGFAVACTPNLKVTAPKPDCTITAPAVLYPGDTFTVNSINGLSGEIQIAGAFWDPKVKPSVNIGNLSPPSTVTNPIPNDFEPGLYAVRVGGFAVHCGDVTVGEWNLDTPDVSYGSTVNFSITPAPNDKGGQMMLLIYRAAPGTTFANIQANNCIFEIGSPKLVAGIEANSSSVSWSPNAVKGEFYAVLAKGTDFVSTHTCFQTRFLLNIDESVRPVNFTWAPPVHVNPGVALIVSDLDCITGGRTFMECKIFDYGAMTTGSTSYNQTKALRSGNFKACLTQFDPTNPFNQIPWDNDDNSCVSFFLSYIHPWISIPLDNDSCIKVHKEGKAGNAPYCAVYNTKFDPADPSDVDNVNGRHGSECTDPGKDKYRLNDQTNVICNLNFKIDSTQMERDDNPSSLRLPTDSNKNGTIDENELGPWDQCTDPDDSGIISCDITINVWPNFRIPFLSQAWNNTLYSDVNETLPTLQQTGRPGFYTFAQPKIAQQLSEQDPLATLLQGYVNSCKADPPVDSDPGNLRGCADIANWAAAGDNADQFPGLEECFNRYLPPNPNISQLTTCLTLVTTTIIEGLIKLPGEVNEAVKGASTGGGQVLAENTGQKERFIGGVECGKHLTRDIMLKPKVLQKHLGVEFQCDLTASTEGVDPGTGDDDPTDDLPPEDDDTGSGELPNPDTCSGRWAFHPQNLLGNFGDPDCDYTESGLYAKLQALDSTNADYWYYTIVDCETGGTYDPNSYNPASTSGEALGNFQMGHAAYPALGYDYQIADPPPLKEYDRGDVKWDKQASNAVDYNNTYLSGDFRYWGCR